MSVGILRTSGARTVALVVPCTKRKRGHVQAEMRFHTLERMTAASLADEWLYRMQNANGHTQAEKLYNGDGWKRSLAARDAMEKCLGNATLYILSAGFGLLRKDDLVPPYSATFAPDEDQIARRVEGGNFTTEAHRSWWKAISEKRGQFMPSRFEELTSHDFILIAAGVDYLQATDSDISKLARTHRQERLFIIGIGTQLSALDPAIRPCLLPVDISVELMLPGPRSTVNQRALQWAVEKVISKVSWDARAVREEISNELSEWRLTRAAMPQRELHRLDDVAVERWISSSLDKKPNLPKHKLLEMFRQGHSCEQKRFFKLVDVVRQRIESNRL